MNNQPKEWVADTRWNNIGVWCYWRQRHAGIGTPWGNIVAKPWPDRLYSERYGSRPHFKLFGACISWVRLKRMLP